MNVARVKAFTKNPKDGNPAGVVVDASSLSDEQMQTIARELGFSESAFVLPSERADYKIRFFTPKQEVDYCGHATLASYHMLFQLPENVGKTSLTQDTKAGVFTVTKNDDGMLLMQQKHPTFLDAEEDKTAIARILGVSEDGIHPSLPVQVVATNVPKLIVPMATVEALQTIQPDYRAMKQYIESHTGNGIYCFTISEHTAHNLAARYFNPAVGINEDPATGTAAGQLACYIDKYFYQGRLKQISINQGMWMGQSSDIYVDLTDGVKVGGYAVDFGTVAGDSKL